MENQQNGIKEQEKRYIITEGAATTILKFLTSLPWAQANDVINFFRRSLTEIPEEPVKESEQPAKQEIEK